MPSFKEIMEAPERYSGKYTVSNFNWAQHEYHIMVYGSLKYVSCYNACWYLHTNMYRYSRNVVTRLFMEEIYEFD